MKKTKALRLWHLRHNLRRILCGKKWIRVKDIKLASVHPHDARGVPFIDSSFDYPFDKDTAIQIGWLLSERKLNDYVDGGDDE